MNIHLPSDLESLIREAVASGRFASVDDALTEAARLLLGDLAHTSPDRSAADAVNSAPDPIVGMMREDTELMDEIVSDAYRRRREDNWRESEL
jgi:Arc/MetJ-type ribon-helix-helix transcriptional regulator